VRIDMSLSYDFFEVEKVEIDSEELDGRRILSIEIILIGRLCAFILPI